MCSRVRFNHALTIGALVTIGSAAAADNAARPAWIAASDAEARVLLDVEARFEPEQATALGLEGFDEQVVDLGPRVFERRQQARQLALATLEQHHAQQRDNPALQQDLAILIAAGREELANDALEQRLLLKPIDVPQIVFQGVRALLDEQVATDRRASALRRLQRYVGATGEPSVFQLAQARLRERLSVPGLLGPPKAEIERSLANSASYVSGIADLLRALPSKDWERIHGALAHEVGAWDAFVRAELLPRARSDFRLPSEVYAARLRAHGIDSTPDELTRRARSAYLEIRNELAALAPLVAREKGWAASDYREVLRLLKRQQIEGEAILPHYRERLRQIEELVRRERVATLPQREARIRLASAAESANLPAPNMRPPRLIGNRGEQGEFVLPLTAPRGPQESAQRIDDFTYDAASWTLCVHELRPGHEMQFAAMVERGVSLARALFAFNSVNVEGWALYAESELKPYLPLDGQLVALQHRLLRAARAFLDPDLQAGRIQPGEAVRFLTDEVVLSELAARLEVERYTFRAPGQAPAYFYGYVRWLELRAQAEAALGRDFDRLRYHDFVLSQGLLPPDLMAKAVLTEFVPAEQKRLATRTP
jgi:uncharacterized protein (DUF885 family)